MNHQTKRIRPVSLVLVVAYVCVGHAQCMRAAEQAGTPRPALSPYNVAWDSPSTDASKDWRKHVDWWSAFWNRSWITVNDNTLPAEEQGRVSHEGYTTHRQVIDPGALVAQSYNVFRYLMACQSRDRIQTKFNGGLYTQPLRYTKKRLPKRSAARRLAACRSGHRQRANADTPHESAADKMR